MRRPLPAKATIAGAIVAAAVSLALPALAHHSDLDDPLDTKGRLDVVRVEFDHTDTRGTWTLITVRSWSIKGLWDHGYAVIEIDASDGPDPDFLVVVASNGTRMVGTLFRHRGPGDDREIDRLRTWKPDGRSISVRVPLAEIDFGAHRTVYRWVVLTLLDVCDQWCIDRVPDDGQIDQPIPGVTPTPSVTASPTPTVSSSG